MIATMSLPVLALAWSEPRTRRFSMRMDEAGFEAFYRRTARKVWAYLARLSGDASSVDDLLQKTYIQFLRATVSFESDEHMRRYLFRVATNVGLDHLREAKRERSRRGGIEPSAQHARGDLRRDMARVFGEMKPRERALLWLAHVEESTHEEIGEALGLRPASVRVLLFRARKKLANLLVRRGLAPEPSR